MNLEKKNIVEFLGAVAILVSLAFVGMQLRQSQNIAVAEGYATIFSTRIDLGDDIKEHANLWRRGNSGDELTDDESAIFAMLVNQINEYNVLAFFYTGVVEGYDAAEFHAKEFAVFLYRNPEARRVWEDRHSYIIEYRSFLSDDGTYSSSWVDGVRTHLAVLDREKPSFGKKPFVDW